MINATTVNPSALAGVLREHSARLARFLPRARHGEARAIHQARVASRRLREALPVAGVLAPAEARSLRRDVRRVTAALGAVRELDVSASVFDESSDGAARPGAAVARVRRHLSAERERRARRLHVKIGRLDADRIASGIEALATVLDAASPQTRMDELLALRVRARARRLAAALRGAGVLYVPAPLHAARIAGKKLRYSLELTRALSRLPLGREITKLRALQGTLGRLHDLQVLQGYLTSVAADAAPDRAVTHALEMMAAGFDAECRELQAVFLRTAPALTKLTARLGGLHAGDLTGAPEKRMARIRLSAASTTRRARSA